MLRVKGLLHYGLQVPSLGTGASFYSAFGLQVAERGNAVVIRCDGRAQDQTVLMEGPVKRLHHVAFAVEPGSLPEWQRHLEGLDVKLSDAPAEVQGGLGSNLFHYVQDPWGSWIEYSGDMDCITENWEPHDWDCPPAVWSPETTADFITNQEAKPV